MWRSGLLGAVLAGVLAGCSLGGGSEGAARGTTPAPSGTQMHTDDGESHAECGRGEVGVAHTAPIHPDTPKVRDLSRDWV
jgi:hypothetical protein